MGAVQLETGSSRGGLQQSATTFPLSKSLFPFYTYHGEGKLPKEEAYATQTAETPQAPQAAQAAEILIRKQGL